MLLVLFRSSYHIDADLRPHFNWDVKQLFVFIVAEYTTAKNVLNQVVVEDFIILNRSDAHIVREPMGTKYPIHDQGNGLVGNSLTFNLYFDIMPITGITRIKSMPAMLEPFKLPDKHRT